jgi:transcriptional regulator with XRE-family HTH domain
MRLQAGLTMEQLAAELGVAVCYIEQVEEGIFSPSLEMRSMISQALHTPWDEAEPPQMEDLYGIDITQGIDSVEYIRGLRDADAGS